MTPGKTTINQLFNGSRVFVIPFYQRSYVWDRPQWERLLLDILMVGVQTTDYFLGTIILKQEPTGTSQDGDYKVVIDGQQRLTTLAILLKVLFLKQNRNEWFERKFILPDGALAIKHSFIDRKDFQKIMNLEQCVELDGQSNIIRAYNFFRENLDIEKINIDRLKNNISMIDIVIDSNDDEQQIFDTINSLGVNLTTAELLKNHLFDERNLGKYEELWEPVFDKDAECIDFWSQSLLKGRNKQKNIEAFFNAFLQIKVHDSSFNISSDEKNEYSKISTLFSSYKKFIEKYYKEREFDFVEELVRYAQIYKETFSPNIIERSLTNKSGIDRINFIIFTTDSTTLIPFVMYVIKNIKEKIERDKIFEYLEAYLLRRIICQSSSKNYSDLFSENLINANIKKVGELVEYINMKEASNALAMPKDVDVLRSCKEIKYTNNNRALAILYLLESKMWNNRLRTTQLLPYNSYTLEHLMPQKWENNWPLPEGGDENERNHKIKTIGNFTMITQRLNAKIGNGAWATKLVGRNNDGLKAYARDLSTLEDFLKLSNWNESEIEKRSEWLGKKIIEEFPLYLPNDSIPDASIPLNGSDPLVTQQPEQINTASNIRDTTKYSLNGGKFMYKCEFVHHFISRYIKKYNNMTYAEIERKFPKELIIESGFRCNGLVCLVEEYEQWNHSSKDKPKRYYHVNMPDGKLISADGKEFYVNSQWTKESIQNILEIAKEDGWSVKEKK